MDNEALLGNFRRRGVLAFCPNCGASKPQYRAVCKSCHADPRTDNLLLARSIMMSTEQFYMRSPLWQDQAPADNAATIEAELIPKLLESAARLQNGNSVQFAEAEETFWLHKIIADRKIKPPKSLVLFLVALYGSLAIVTILFLKFLLF